MLESAGRPEQGAGRHADAGVERALVHLERVDAPGQLDPQDEAPDGLETRVPAGNEAWMAAAIRSAEASRAARGRRTCRS